MTVPKMHVDQHEDGKWYIMGVPEIDEGCGPYETKALAEDDMRGIARFYKHYDEPGYLTVDDPRVKKTDETHRTNGEGTPRRRRVVQRPERAA